MGRSEVSGTGTKTDERVGGADWCCGSDSDSDGGGPASSCGCVRTERELIERVTVTRSAADIQVSAQ